jgi:hypothetical protein
VTENLILNGHSGRGLGRLGASRGRRRDQGRRADLILVEIVVELVDGRDPRRRFQTRPLATAAPAATASTRAIRPADFPGRRLLVRLSRRLGLEAWLGTEVSPLDRPVPERRRRLGSSRSFPARDVSRLSGPIVRSRPLSLTFSFACRFRLDGSGPLANAFTFQLCGGLGGDGPLALPWSIGNRVARSRSLGNRVAVAWARPDGLPAPSASGRLGARFLLGFERFRRERFGLQLRLGGIPALGLGNGLRGSAPSSTAPRLALASRGGRKLGLANVFRLEPGTSNLLLIGEGWRRGRRRLAPTPMGPAGR